MPHGIALNNVDYRTADGHDILDHLSTAFGPERTGLIGDNGTGKTTVLRLIAGDIAPTDGTIIRNNLHIAYLPQDDSTNTGQTVAQILGAEEKLTAVSPQAALAALGLRDLDLDTPLENLSGGEHMRVRLADILVQDADFILLDEPTNNLDAASRAFVYDFVSRWNKGVIVVSHDRELLARVDHIVELSTFGAKSYGGNYDLYLEQKNLETDAARRHLGEARMEFKHAKRQAQEVRETQERRTSQGRKNRDKLGLSGAVLNEMASNAGRTTGRLNVKHKNLIADAHASIQEAKKNVAKDNQLHADLSGTRVPSGKMICRFEDVSFAYTPGRNILEHFNLEIFGPERIAIHGSNGSGKTTLVRLLTRSLSPQSGSVSLGIERFAYLDQHVRLFKPGQTLLASAQERTHADEKTTRNWLMQFMFYGDDVFKKTEKLSGGERMRAALACILAGDTPPQLLILDEPTNNLDIKAVEQVESILQDFEGCLVVISHDQTFLKNVSITRDIRLT